MKSFILLILIPCFLLACSNIEFSYKEDKLNNQLYNKTNIKIKTVEEVVKHSDIIFVPIQTPHGEKFEGTTRIPDEKEDFDYSYLIDGLTELDYELHKQKKEMTFRV